MNLNIKELESMLKDTNYLVDIVTADDITQVLDAKKCAQSELEDCIQQFIYEYELIYYNNAVGFLKKNDPSLRSALSLASDAGYTLDVLDSETLATLLCHDLAIEELHNLDLNKVLNDE